LLRLRVVTVYGCFTTRFVRYARYDLPFDLPARLPVATTRYVVVATLFVATLGCLPLHGYQHLPPRSTLLPARVCATHAFAVDTLLPRLFGLPVSALVCTFVTLRARYGFR